MTAKLILLFGIGLFVFGGTTAFAWQDAGNGQNLNRRTFVDEFSRSIEQFNVATPTLGGQQFWTDCLFRRGWRIQQHSETGNYRLLDNRNIRQARGSFEHCRHRLNQLHVQKKLAPESGKVVILLHGLIRTSNSMSQLEEHLANQGYQVLNLRYASSRKEIQDHAEALHSVISNLPDQVSEINFVAHSMGNLVIRRYLNDQTSASSQGDPRIRRMVMIGPPNQGSRMAQLLNRSVLFHAIAGKSGAQLSNPDRWKKARESLATPRFEFGIIAGGQASSRNLSNWLLAGPDDFTVSVQEAKLPGASDFLVRPLLHSTMSSQPVVLQTTTRFLKHGYFVSESARQTIDRKSRQ